MSNTYFVDALKHRMLHVLIIFCCKIFLVVAQCVLLRGTLLPDSKPYRHLHPRHFRPLDAEVLVSAAFSLMAYVPQEVGGGAGSYMFWCVCCLWAQQKKWGIRRTWQTIICAVGRFGDTEFLFHSSLPYPSWCRCLTKWRGIHLSPSKRQRTYGVAKLQWRKG